MATKQPGAWSVSPDNPCPFLRALVAEGTLADTIAPLDKISATLVAVARAGEGRPELPARAHYAIALIANGLSPGSLLRSMRLGMRLNARRGGPLDKKGASSGILDVHGSVTLQALARLQGFASQKVGADDVSELGMDAQEVESFLDASFKRAAGRRRRIGRALMNGEWPVLWKVMGNDGPGGRHLSLADVQRLFAKRRLPQRMRVRRVEPGARAAGRDGPALARDASAGTAGRRPARGAELRRRTSIPLKTGGRRTSRQKT